MVIQGSVDEPKRSEVLCIHELGVSAGSTVVDSDRQLVSKDTFYISISHCHCHHVCQYRRLGCHAQGSGLHNVLFH